jgi:hypothetical protein
MLSICDGWNIGCKYHMFFVCHIKFDFIILVMEINKKLIIYIGLELVVQLQLC